MAQTIQLEAWTGSLGDEYVERCNATEEAIGIRTRAWQEMLQSISHPSTILEIGCNVGINQRALQRICNSELFAVEPNPKARSVVLADKVLDNDHLVEANALALPFADQSMEMAFTCGVLIHIANEDLLQACSEIYRVSSRYILCAEYFSKNPEKISYRGREDLLYKRDFGSYWIDNFSLKTIANGFHWSRTTGMDDVTWWLFEKSDVKNGQ